MAGCCRARALAVCGKNLGGTAECTASSHCGTGLFFYMIFQGGTRMKEALQTIRAEAKNLIAEAADETALEALRVRLLGT